MPLGMPLGMHVVRASVSALAEAPANLNDTNTEFGAQLLICLQPRLANMRTPNGEKSAQAVNGRMSVDLDRGPIAAVE
jgi:hypothetical protein